MPEQNLFEPKPRDLFEYLESIRSNVQFFIGSRSLKSLSHYIDGFEAALWVIGLNDKPTMFIAFHTFVETAYGDNTTRGWPTLILEHCKGDEDAALEEFYRLLDQYKLTLS